MTEQEALTRIQKICSQQEKCIQDAKRKLDSWKINDAAVRKILRLLVEGKFIDENRYARSFANDKFKFNKWGKVKITYALHQKKIDDRFINKAIEEIEEEDYKETVIALLKKKRMSLRGNDMFNLRNKLIKFALSKGFEYDLILQAVQVVINEELTGE